LKRDNIVVHDPSSSSDCCETIPLTTLQKGILKGDIDGLPLPAEGFRCFRNKYGTYGIIDGVIILELKENMLRRAAGSQVKIIAHSR
jgi:hypothetical protein